MGACTKVFKQKQKQLLLFELIFCRLDSLSGRGKMPGKVGREMVWLADCLNQLTLVLRDYFAPLANISISRFAGHKKQLPFLQNVKHSIVSFFVTEVVKCPVGSSLAIFFLFLMITISEQTQQQHCQKCPISHILRSTIDSNGGSKTSEGIRTRPNQTFPNFRTTKSIH